MKEETADAGIIEKQLMIENIVPLGLIFSGVETGDSGGSMNRGSWARASTAGGMGDASPNILADGMQCLSSPLAATNLCQSSQCHIQLSVDCHSSCMNGDIWR